MEIVTDIPFITLWSCQPRNYVSTSLHEPHSTQSGTSAQLSIPRRSSCRSSVPELIRSTTTQSPRFLVVNEAARWIAGRDNPLAGTRSVSSVRTAAAEEGSLNRPLPEEEMVVLSGPRPLWTERSTGEERGASVFASASGVALARKNTVTCLETFGRLANLQTES